MRRPLLMLVALALAAALLVPAALAARVSVRVEGRTKTLFGALETRFEAGTNALTALEAASVRGEFYYHVTQFAFGRLVDQIGRYPTAASSGWVFKVNGASPPVGAEAVQLNDGDRVLWYWAPSFGPPGPPTLHLTRTGRNCYRVVAENDEGADRAAAGAVLHVDGQRIRTRAGRGCVGRHIGLVRATMAGAVRSNALR